MVPSIFDELQKTLISNKDFLDESGKLIKSKVETAALQMDPHLLSALLSSDSLKKAFFTEVNGVEVFDKVNFSWVLNDSEFLPDSFTSFKNKIGLINQGRDFISKSDDVVLSFPYKDCEIEFDSTDENEKRDEVFLNEVLCGKEINALLDKKAFSNASRHSKEGVSPTETYNDDNLVIKGNNLMSLYSLLPRFEGKIQMMYWDILYNTGSDQVPYNDSFKHSSWLAMMKNRLDAAYKLLKETGFIFVHLDAGEMAYLKVLMDEIFGRDHYVSTITCKVKAPSGVASGAQMIFDCSEYILVYAKNPLLSKYNNLTEDSEVIDEKSKTAEFYKYRLTSISYDHMELVKDLGDEKVYRIKKSDFSIEQMKDKSSLSYYMNREGIFRTAALSGGREKVIAEIVRAQPDNLESMFVFEHTPNKGKNAGKLVRDLIYKNGGILWLSDFSKVDDENKCLVKCQHITSIFNNDWWQGISSEGDTTLKNGKKPEILLKTLIDMSTDPGDWVLDAYFGTGTTGAVAMKMGRHFVGLEQLGEHFDKAVTRLDGVIAGEQSGVSKAVNWHGGGSFVSCELLKENQHFVDSIQTASGKDLDAIYQNLMDSPFVLNYQVATDVISQIQNKDSYLALSDDDKKKVLIALLDKNLLYVCLSDINDSDLHVLDKDKDFTKSFYGA